MKASYQKHAEIGTFYAWSEFQAIVQALGNGAKLKSYGSDGCLLA